MDLVMVLIALTLPSLMGISLLNLLVPAHTPGRGAIVSGTGIMAGIILLPLLMHLVNLTSIGLSFVTTAILITLIAATAIWLKRLQRAGDTIACDRANDLPAPSRLARLLYTLFIALAAWHLVLPTLELLSRPLFAWDTTMHWATKSKVWFHSEAIKGFVGPRTWLELGGRDVFTDNNAGYPATTPLLQVWISLAISRWDESLMHLPWSLCFAAFGVAFYGMARAAAVRPVSAAIFTYLLLSLPLLGTHVALAGYADLFVSATFGIAAMAFYLWSVERKYWQATLTAFFAFAGVIVKEEGILWLAAFLPALAVAQLKWQWSLLTIAGTLLTVLLMFISLPGDLDFAGQSLDTLDIHYRHDAAEKMITSFWSMSGLNLLTYLIAGLPFLLLCAEREELYRLRGLITLLLSVLAIFLFVFTFTGFSAGVMRLTSVWRVALHFMPAALFLLMLVFEGRLTSAQQASAESSKDTQTA